MEIYSSGSELLGVGGRGVGSSVPRKTVGKGGKSSRRALGDISNRRAGGNGGIKGQQKAAQGVQVAVRKDEDEVAGFDTCNRTAESTKVCMGVHLNEFFHKNKGPVAVVTKAPVEEIVEKEELDALMDDLDF
mmetsp:Transcript_9309/g.15148  ORF Transcript_9309/g.15148 Transcript_9309/m.15148 type:complete len:132 (-) Transcript_9309:2077-2472(-)